jgi:hypothetical protein
MKLLKVLVVLSMLLTLTAGVVGAGQEAAESQEAPSDRFEIYTHNFLRNGVHSEVFIKIDRFTGRLWKMDGSREVQWKSIPEQETDKPVPAETVRYDLYCHEFSKDSEAQEVYLRYDRLTGKTWRWSGNQPGWEVVEQDN